MIKCEKIFPSLSKETQGMQRLDYPPLHEDALPTQKNHQQKKEHRTKNVVRLKISMAVRFDTKVVTVTKCTGVYLVIPGVRGALYIPPQWRHEEASNFYLFSTMF